jgi:hypothetical protein
MSDNEGLEHSPSPTPSDASDAEEFILPPKRAPTVSVNTPHSTFPQLLQIKDYVSARLIRESCRSPELGQE